MSSRRAVVVVLAIAVALAAGIVAMCTSRQFAGGEGVRNGDFEDGLEGWSVTGAAAIAGDAHSGGSCVGGALGVDGWSVTQARVGVRKDTPYRITAWLRATGTAEVVLSADERGKHSADERIEVDEVPSKWTRYETDVVPQHDDRLALTIAARGDPEASVFVDDVEVREVAFPTATQIEPGLGFDDEPSMARAADGTLWLAWISFRRGKDSLQVARLRALEDATFETLGTWSIECREVVAPRVSGNQLSFIADTHLGESPPRALPLAEYTLTADGPVRPEKPSPWTGDPVTCELRDSNWDLYWGEARPFDTGEPRIRLTRAPTIDRNPVLVPHGDATWLVYENAESPGYRVELTTPRRLVVAKIGANGLETPKNYMKTSPLWLDRCENPAAAFDDKGRLWIAYRRPHLPQAGWDVWLTGWTGDAWVPPIPISAKKGMDRAPSLAIDGNRAILAFQADDLPASWGQIDRIERATSGVFVASVPLPDVPAAPQQLEPLVENPAPWEAAEIRRRFGDDKPREIAADVGGDTLHLLFGDLHAHSDTSVCQRVDNGSADEVYEMERDFLHLDFTCLTDHGEDMNAYLWNRQAKLARWNAVDDKMTIFLGQEWSSSFEEKSPEHPYGFYGHRNLILGDLDFPRWWNPRNRETPAQLWADLRAAHANFITIPHQLADVGTNVPIDWSFTDEVAQPVAEIFQVRGSYEAKDAPRAARRTTPEASYFLHGALERGVVVGVIASPDHGGGTGKACVWSKGRSREEILDALRARRCYGTTGARIALEVRVNGHFMGEKAKDGARDPVEIVVKAACPGDVERVSLCRGGAWIDAKTPASREFELRFTDEHPPAGAKWYYVRVEQKDGELAWSSPVWLGAK